MMLLEAIATCALIGFIAGIAALIITSVLKLVSNNKVLDKVLMTAIWVYGGLGFTTIILSFIAEMLR
jgi:hypothetical protein